MILYLPQFRYFVLFNLYLSLKSSQIGSLYRHLLLPHNPQITPNNQTKQINPIPIKTNCYLKYQFKSPMNPTQQHPKTQIGDYLIYRTLGKGAFGKVKLGVHKRTNQQVAIKILEKRKITDIADIERVRREIYIMKFVRHPNVIQLYDLIETPKYLMLVMEYVEKGELFQHIVRNRVLGEDEACGYFHQLINAVEYIHKLKFAHRDIKLQNLLLDYNMNLKLVDFGLSNTYPSGQLLKTSCGSRQYAAPQLLTLQPYNGLKVDIWSCGVVLYTMLCGCLPYQDEDHNEFTKKIQSGKLEITTALSGEAEDLLKRILEAEPEKRYTVEQIRRHPWMKKAVGFGEGIVVGYNRIPVDGRVIERLVELGFDGNTARKQVQANRHNSTTAAYYLLLKKLMKQGLDSPYSLSSKNFDVNLITPIPHNPREQNHQLLIIQQMLQPHSASVSLTLKPPPKPSETSSQLDIGKQNTNYDVNRKRSKSRGYTNRPPPKLHTKMDQISRSRDLVTPANRMSVVNREPSKSRERKVSKSTKRQRIASNIEAGEKKRRLSGCNVSGRADTHAMLDISSMINNAVKGQLSRQHQRATSKQVSVSHHVQMNESLNLNAIVEKYYTHHRG